jgi:hypothetical protein
MRGCVAFFVFIFVAAPLILAFEVTAAASTFLVNRDFYGDMLSSPEIYAAMLEGLMDDAGVSAELRASGELERITATLDTAEWRAAVDEAIDQAFAVLEGRSDTISINIPLAPVRAILQSSAAAEFVSDYVGELPACSGGREPMDAPDTITGLPLPVCRPQNLSPREYSEQLLSDLPRVIENMPDTLTYTDTVPDGPRIGGLGEVGLQQAVTTAVIILGVIALGAWLSTGIVAGDSAGSRLRWLGVTLLLPSVIVVLIGLGIASVSALAVNRGAVLIDGGISSRLSETVYEALTGGVGRISTSFLIAGGIPSVIGLGLLVIGFAIPAPRRDEMQRDMYANPTMQYGPYDGKPKNDFEVFNKPKNDGKEKNDDIIKPL